MRNRKPHRAVGSPALCGLKLLCEFSQARAVNRNRKRGRKTSEKSGVYQAEEVCLHTREENYLHIHSVIKID